MKRGEKSPLTYKKERGKSMSDYEYKYLKPYKGYDVVKAYELDDDGRHTGAFVYIVQDDEDMIGELRHTACAQPRQEPRCLYR